jgi:hypothetical protein
VASKQPSDVDRIKEVIRLLNLTLEGCQRLLFEAELAVVQSHQDNTPISSTSNSNQDQF